MAKFILFHPLPVPMELSQVEPVARLAKRFSGADAYWIGSQVQIDAQGKAVKIVCEWDAKDQPTLEALVAKLVKEIPVPVEGPFPMIKVDGETYR